MAFALQPTTPAAAYRPTYGVTYQGQLQPTSRPAMGYGTGGTMGIPTPGMKPTAPPMPSQQPTMGAPAALSGANGLAGTPQAMAGAAPAAGGGLLGIAPGTRKSPSTYGGYDSFNGDVLAGLGLAGMAMPGVGLLGTAGHIYNTAEYDNALSKLNMPGLSFGQWLGGILGLNDYGYGGRGPSTKDVVNKDANAFANSVAAGAAVHGSNNAGMGGAMKASGQAKPGKTY